VTDRGYGLATVPATFRPATPDDAEPVARLVIDGFETYRAFTPPGWEPPALAIELEHLGRLFADDAFWILLAEDAGRLVGQVSIIASQHTVHPDADPALVHFRNLFVAQDQWGTALATALHGAAVSEARARGFEQMRLFTPAEHAPGNGARGIPVRAGVGSSSP
jgi:GNAT superfamily N-acetyltransferase